MRKRGVGLVIALVVITLIGSTISLLTLQVTAMASQRQHEKNRTYAQILLDSGIAYAQMHHDQLAQNPPLQPITLPVDQLLPSAVKAGLTLERLDDSGTIQIRTWAGTARLQVHQEQTMTL